MGYTEEKCETYFAMNALMEIPEQYASRLVYTCISAVDARRCPPFNGCIPLILVFSLLCYAAQGTTASLGSHQEESSDQLPHSTSEAFFIRNRSPGKFFIVITKK